MNWHYIELNEAGRKSLRPDMRCHVGIAIGLGVAAVGASVAGGIEQSKAQKAASQQQANSQQSANKQNLQEFEESRGSTGSAVLPLYLKEGGTPFEGQLGQDLIGAYNDTFTPLSSFQSAIAPLAGAETKANEFTNDIFTGGVTNKLLSEAAPVQAARLSTARQSAMTSLNQTLDAIDAAQAGKGFSGDSFGNRNLRFSANLAENNAVSGANLQNLQENQQIQNYGNVTLPLQNLNLPASMSEQAGQLAFLPQSNFLQSTQARTAPFDFMRIAPGNPPASQPLPTPPPAFGTGAAVAGAVSSAGSTALNYYLNQQLLRNQAQNTSTSTAAATNSSGNNPFSVSVEPFTSAGTGGSSGGFSLFNNNGGLTDPGTGF